MTREILFTHAQVVMPSEVFQGTVHVKDGWISSVDKGRSSVPGALDLENDYLIPGMIELHTDNLEKHFVPRPGVRWPSMAAVMAHDASLVSSGITTVFDALALGEVIENGIRLRDLSEMIGAVRTARTRDLLRCEHFLHLRCEIIYPRVVDLFRSLVGDPLVRLVSLMDHTPGQRQFTKMEKLYEYYQGKYGFSGADMETFVLRSLSNQREYAVRHRDLLLRICREHQIPVASHDDTTVEHVVEAATDGIVLCEFPTTIEAARAACRHGLRVLAGAPNLVLGRSHSGNVSAIDLAEQGTLNILSSDYVPSSLVHGVFLLHDKLGFPLPEAVSVVTANPARAVNLTDRGMIQPGKRADLVRVRKDGPSSVVRNVWRCGIQVY